MKHDNPPAPALKCPRCKNGKLSYDAMSPYIICDNCTGHPERYTECSPSLLKARELAELEKKATQGEWTFEPSRTKQGTKYQHICSGCIGILDTYHSDRIVSQAADLALGGDGDGFIEARDGRTEDAQYVTELHNAFPSILSELEKVTQHREELLAMVKSIGNGALIHLEENKVLAAENEKLREGYTKMRETLESMQWKGNATTFEYEYGCPSCWQLEKDGHESDCILQQALTSFPPLQ